MQGTRLYQEKCGLYPIEEEEIICQWLSQKKGQEGAIVVVPEKGRKRTAGRAGSQKCDPILTQDREKVKTGRIARLRGDRIRWGSDRHRRDPPVEAYDISNTSGVESVGSMVVYEDGKPKRSDYRKFKIRTVQGPNDYASMEEVLTRRFSHGIQGK